MIPWITGWTLGLFAAGAPAISPAAEPASLVAMAEFPSGWTERSVRFVVQFDELTPEWSPLMTRFSSADWCAFSGWADEQHTWEPATFARPQRRLFVPRESALELELLRARRFDRFEVQAVCREVFGFEPWIEIQRVVPLEERVGEGTLVCVRRAYEALANGQFEIAMEQLARARQGPLPPTALDGLDKLEHAFEQEKSVQIARRSASDPTSGRRRR